MTRQPLHIDGVVFVVVVASFVFPGQVKQQSGQD
jgi:hypothetical protein